MSLQLQGSVPQTETIITYGYNDDFEKVAKTEMRQAAVPGIYAMLNASPGLVQYLRRQAIINDSGAIARNVFPLYQLYVSPAAQSVRISTAVAPLPRAQPVTDGNIVGVDVAFRRLEEQLPSLKQYLWPLEALEVRGKNDKGHLRFKASLRLTNKQKNALLELAEQYGKGKF
jgi:hypothetical protein